MTKQEQIIEKLLPEFRNDPNCLAILVTGSVARMEASENSDIDLLQISNSEQPFRELTVDGILVEIKTHTKQGFIEKIKTKPMSVYQWLDAKVILGDKAIAQEMISTAKNIYENYESDHDEVKAMKKWLESTRLKISESIKKGDDLSAGFYVSNILWKIVEGLYLSNNRPTPPSTTALRRITELKTLPKDFSQIWQSALIGDLGVRTGATLALIDFILSQ